MEDSQVQAQEETTKEAEEQQFIFSSKGEPFKSENTARVALSQKNLDPDVYRVKKIKHEVDGKEVEVFVLENREYGVPEKYRGYWRVKFSDRSNPNDPEDVAIPVNGETLVIQRNKETIVPGRFLEAADNATFPHFIQRPNQPRKVIGSIATFPHERRGRATKEEFLALREEGNKKTSEQIKKFGFDYDQEVS